MFKQKSHRLSIGNLCASAAVMLFLFCAMTAKAGAISDDVLVTNVFSCDSRVDVWSTTDLSWCTADIANKVRNSCYLVVHPRPGSLSGRECSWQGCGQFSLVGKSPNLLSGKVIEYGITTTPPSGTTYETVADGVLPKRPYGRHYMKVGDAIAARKSCPANSLNLPTDVFNAICGADLGMAQLNMYWKCAASPL